MRDLTAIMRISNRRYRLTGSGYSLHRDRLVRASIRLTLSYVKQKMEIDKFIVTDKMFTPSGMGDIPDKLEDLPMTPISASYAKSLRLRRPRSIRVYCSVRAIFRKIIENMEKAQNKVAKERYEAYLTETTDGVLTASASGGGNINKGVLNIIEAHAFNYALTGNERRAERWRLMRLLTTLRPFRQWATRHAAAVTSSMLRQRFTTGVIRF